MSIIQYTLNDYNAILLGKYNPESLENHIVTPLSYKLSEDVINTINILIKKFGDSTIQLSQQNTLVKGRNDNRRNNYNNLKGGDESWTTIRNFKPTTVMEKKEGVEKIMNDIRIALNKISNKNYDVNRDMIVGLINDLSNQSNTTEADVAKIANNIFEIASTNKFFSDIYASLYKDISEKFPEMFKPILSSFLDGFTETMKTIKYVDQSDNFDDFCEYNKTNDKRKATSVFITNLLKKQLIESNILIDIITKIQIILDGYIEDEGVNKTNEVEQITENIFLLVTNNEDFLKSCKNTDIMRDIKKLSSFKSKDYKNVSSRAIFKFLDILDKINK